MRSFIIIAACCLASCAVASAASATPVVSFNNSFDHFYGVPSQHGAVLSVNASKVDGCTSAAYEKVEVVIGDTSLGLSPCDGYAPHGVYDGGVFSTLNVSYLDRYRGAQLDITSYPDTASRSLPIKVRWHGRAIFKGTLTFRNNYTPPTRIYEGTDGFVNICIDQNKTVYSSDLKLYCNVGGGGSSFASIRRNG